MRGYVYAITTPATAVGFLFEYPLKTTEVTGTASKVLWLVSLPRNGSDLVVGAHPLGDTSPTVRESLPANAGPGEIYPDGIAIPKPGCWHVTLSWANNRAEIDLPYAA